MFNNNVDINRLFDIVEGKSTANQHSSGKYLNIFIDLYLNR